MKFLIVTGLSGAGKSQAMHALEDLDFFCIDNMPPKLMTKFAELSHQATDDIERVAVAIDVRSKKMFSDLFDSLQELNRKNYDYKILFLDAQDQTIIRRYKETRRRHPLALDGKTTIQEAITKERKLLHTARVRADYVVDTTLLSNAQLKESMRKLFLANQGDSMVVNCMSFGFKFGTPQEADLMFDVRCLPNPFYVDELKSLTGLDEPVRDYVLKFPQSQGLLTHLTGLLDYLMPLYQAEGKSQLVIAIGCTGGKHRSVVFTEQIAAHLREKSMKVVVNHRDIERKH